MNMKNKVMMYLLGLIIMGIGFLCYFYREWKVLSEWYGTGEWVYPYQQIGFPLVFIGIAIMVVWIAVDVLGWLAK